MAKNRIVRLEIWNDYPGPKVTKIEKSALEKAIRSMASEQCADVLIDDPDNDSGDGIIEGFPSFIVCASEGNYSASAILDENSFYDLVGNPLASGWVDFTIGGQEAPFPRKYIVSAEQAIAAASEYLKNGEVVVTRFDWDKQQEPGNAWDQE